MRFEIECKTIYFNQRSELLLGTKADLNQGNFSTPTVKFLNLDAYFKSVSVDTIKKINSAQLGLNRAPN